MDIKNPSEPSKLKSPAKWHSLAQRVRSAGTKPSGCTSPDTPASTLPGGGYFQGYSYDNLDRLNLGDLGIYAYASSAHVHAPTSITYGSAAYTATYDLAGNLVCRAPTNATTCAGQNPTGAQLRYDAEERLASWQNAPTNPTTTATYLYDGAGERVAAKVTASGTTTTTAYLGNEEEVATTGASTTTTTYCYAAGQRIALAVNGVFSYLATPSPRRSTAPTAACATAAGRCRAATASPASAPTRR